MFTAKSPKVHKKRISVDDKILSVISSSDLDDNSAATDVTQSDVFHSIINTLRDDDATMKSDEDEGDDITLDIDTPDDMQDSILERKLLLLECDSKTLTLIKISKLLEAYLLMSSFVL